MSEISHILRFNTEPRILIGRYVTSKYDAVSIQYYGTNDFQIVYILRQFEWILIKISDLNQLNCARLY